MCGRYSLTVPLEVIARHWFPEARDALPGEPGARYNIPPGTDIPVARTDPDGQIGLTMACRHVG